MSFKDSPEGQTHSYNDGCGEKEHNQSWEEFDYVAGVSLPVDRLGTNIGISGGGIRAILPIQEELSLESRVALQDFLNKKLKEINNIIYRKKQEWEREERERLLSQKANQHDEEVRRVYGEKILNLLEGMKRIDGRGIKTCGCTYYEGCGCRVEDYNKAIKEAIEKINNI